jgi:hypothetical protein
MTFANMRRSAQQNRDDLKTGCYGFLALPPIALVICLILVAAHFVFGWPS